MLKGFQRVSARRNYELDRSGMVPRIRFQRVSARRNYELYEWVMDYAAVSSVSLHVGIMNFLMNFLKNGKVFPACLCT